MGETDQAWFTFRIAETEEGGVELPKLVRVLERLSSAFYAVARARIGEVQRPGPRSTAEEALAAVRLVRVEPGSATIELAPPRPALQATLQLDNEVTADDVAFDFVQEVVVMQSRARPSVQRWDVQKRVRELVEEAGVIGRRAEIVFRPLVAKAGMPAEVTTWISTQELPAEVRPSITTRTRRVSGHAYMVDVEPGRQRVRVKMPDGRDVTVDVAEQLIPTMRSALDSVVELQISETLEGTVVTDRVVREVSVLPSAGPGSDKPPKSIAELEREQGLPGERPDYGMLASLVWQTQGDIGEFDEHIRQIRHAEAV